MGNPGKFRVLCTRLVRPREGEVFLFPCARHLRWIAPVSACSSRIFSPFSLTDLMWNLHQDQQNYASSRCCLGELLEMMECKISRGHLVLPILYKVEPEDVELLLVMLAKRFCLREKHVDEKVEDQWEEVLIEIRSLKGWDSKKDVNRELKRFETKAENKVGQIVYQDGGVTLFVSHIFDIHSSTMTGLSCKSINLK
ncbi:hypothetical protein EUGRSUZ_C03843 [Eucalyptus grandis]|uniref:ADP-ribosyl cyclase/cyclic ADP-ribose hydrolase n=2 Tax=Eucalyptus grandis TaxID=71139 RepID=A0A059CW80_EUCGR|nr:hypothetical protein EUGRSUZ_C03843 [Eucalyptus grandis]